MPPPPITARIDVALEDRNPQPSNAAPVAKAKTASESKAPAQPPESRANNRPRKRGKWPRRIGIFVLGAVATKTIDFLVGWPLERVLKEPVRELRWPASTLAFQLRKPAPSVKWSLTSRRPTNTELEKLSLIRNKPPHAIIITLKIRNTGEQELSDLAVSVEADKRIVAHQFPLALGLLDGEGQPISDPLRRFSYEKRADLRFPLVPTRVSLTLWFVMPEEAAVSVYCRTDGAFIPPSPASLDDEKIEEIFSNISYTPTQP